MSAAFRTEAPTAYRWDPELADGFTWPTLDRAEADAVELGDRAAAALGDTVQGRRILRAARLAALEAMR